MNTTINRVVFLDFDGVLFDTVREVYTVSMMALDPSNRISDIDFGSKHFEKFNQLRYLIGPAWNYYYAMKAIEKIPSTDDLEIKYKSLIDQKAQGKHSCFEKKFFQVRQQLREKEHDHWLSMTSPYNIVEDLRIIMRKFKEHFFLVTTRDSESVKDLMDLHNMDILDSNIFAKSEYESYRSKKNIIKSLINKYQIEEALFIDDLEEHLESCGTIEGLSTIQAKWGYVVPAKKEDNSAVLLKELERFIHGENVRA
jgi:phosphoglycolate phosphatase-like HAD superfamily hydrolase